ncbi:16S/23S rRNA (cytidine-2'-O)-methyltransferase, partial [Nocardia cyriacigeorgica]
MSSRLDQELTARALARSRTVAARWIGEGRVLVNGRPATKPSVRVGPEDLLEVRPADVPDYVSRAGHKLAGALAA